MVHTLIRHVVLFFFFSSRRRHTRFDCDWSSDVCSSDLATAAALRRVGIDVTVYEQAAQFTRLGAGIQIGCNAMKVLRGLGLEQRLRAQSFYPRSWNNRDWKTGEVKFDMIFGESAEKKFGAPYLLAHRGDLHAALDSAIPDQYV